MLLSTARKTSVSWAMCGKQYHDTFPSSRNLETAYCTAWHARWKPQDKDFKVFK